MKKFLAIDTSSKYLTVIAYNEKPYITFIEDCLMNHSTVLMGAIEQTLEKADMKAGECDFFAVCVGAGSFTGIRIGMATVKGFCTAFDKKALAVTSFESLAYSVEGDVIALVDALRGKYYACGYGEDKNITVEPCFITEEELLALKGDRKLISYEKLNVDTEILDPAQGFLKAVLAKAEFSDDAEKLSALYIRRSQAEESLK